MFSIQYYKLALTRCTLQVTFNQKVDPGHKINYYGNIGHQVL